MITQLGSQLVAQKKAIVETRNAMIQLRQENEHLRHQLQDLESQPSITTYFSPSVENNY